MTEPVVPGQKPPEGQPPQPPPTPPPSGGEPPAPTPPPTPSAIDINTAVYPDTPDIPEALRGKPLKEGISKMLGATTETERLKSIVAKQEADFKALEEKLKPPPTQPLSDEEQKRQDEEKFVNDPVGFMRADHQKRMEPLYTQYFKNQEEFQESLMPSRYPKYAESPELREKVRELMDKVEPQLRMNKETWDMAYKLARFEELERFEAEVMAGEGYHVEHGGGAPPPPAPKVELTEAEKAAAHEWGMSEEDYSKWSNPLAGAEE